MQTYAISSNQCPVNTKNTEGELNIQDMPDFNETLEPSAAPTIHGEEYNDEDTDEEQEIPHDVPSRRLRGSAK